VRFGLRVDHCRDVGRAFDNTSRMTTFNILLGESDAEFAELTARCKRHFERIVGADGIGKTYANNHVKGGGIADAPEHVVERLDEWESARLGCAIACFEDVAEDRRGVDLIASVVMPHPA
jgi:hypothetical protein